MQHFIHDKFQSRLYICR